MGAKPNSKTNLPKEFFDFLYRFVCPWLKSLQKVFMIFEPNVAEKFLLELKGRGWHHAWAPSTVNTLSTMNII